MSRKLCFYMVLLVLFVGSGHFTIALGDEEQAAVRETTGIPDPAEYEIGSGDVLNIVTWKEPDFTLEVVVRIDGKITFPLLDDIQAAGRTPVAVKTDIEKRLKEYIADPIVTVIIQQPLSQKFYILGEVVNTGEYPIFKELYVLQAFALAGGFTEWADKNEIILLRREAGEPKIIRIKYKDIIKGKNLELDMQIRANDTIIVP